MIEMAEHPIKCALCGRFISMRDTKAKIDHFEPDSHLGPEIIEWLCGKCVNDSRA
jgi:hypothetical protein